MDYETTKYGNMELRRASLVLRQTTRLLVNKTTSGASQGFARRLRRLVVYKKAIKKKH